MADGPPSSSTTPAAARHCGSPGRTERLLQDITALDAAVDRMALDDRAPIHPARVIRTARSVFPRDTVLGVDVGALAQHIGGAFPFFRVYRPRSVITPSSFYGMGFAAAAPPAARLVHPRRPALCFAGDGSFQMVMNIVPMAAQYGLAVTWCVLNDDALGSIRDLQEHTYGNRIQDTEFPFQPDSPAWPRHAARTANASTTRPPYLTP
ncbi:thiamine pyrophosphate-dependent enzyme [Streptomyces sp. NPDC101152]|uniref:thiamine pyrophosphate-dependent enzyme n=1 Tax=Streptomyces sp. NPDC101152 TaxID=3366116 RepID=UPI00380233EE